MRKEQKLNKDTDFKVEIGLTGAARRASAKLNRVTVVDEDSPLVKRSKWGS
jgi:hypothetical protein